MSREDRDVKAISENLPSATQELGGELNQVAVKLDLDSSLESKFSSPPNANLLATEGAPTQQPPEAAQSPAPSAPPESPRPTASATAAAVAAPTAQSPLPLVAAQPRAAAAIQNLSAAKKEYEAAVEGLEKAFPKGNPLLERALKSVSELNGARPSNVKAILTEMQEIEHSAKGTKGSQGLTDQQFLALEKFSDARDNYVKAGLEKHHAGLYPNASAQGFSTAESSNQVAPAVAAPGVIAATEEGEMLAETEEKAIKGKGERPPGTDPLDHLADLKGNKVFWESVDADGNKTKSEIKINDDGSVSSNDPEALAKYAAAKGWTSFEIDKGEPHDVILAMQAMEKEGVPNVTLAGAAKAKMDKLVAKDPTSEIAQEYSRLQASFKASSEAYDKPGAFLDPGAPSVVSQAQLAATAGVQKSTATSEPLLNALAGTPTTAQIQAAFQAPTPADASSKVSDQATASVSQATAEDAFTPPAALTARSAAAASAPPAEQLDDIAKATTPSPSAPPSEESPRTQKAMGGTPASTLSTPEVLPESVKAASASATTTTATTTSTMAPPPSLQTPAPTSTPTVAQPTFESAAERLAKQEAAEAAKKSSTTVSTPTTAPAAKATEKKAFGMEKISQLTEMMSNGDVKAFVTSLIDKIATAAPGNSANLLLNAEKGLNKLDAKIDKKIEKLESAMAGIDEKIKKVDDKITRLQDEIQEFKSAVPKPSSDNKENEKMWKKDAKGHERIEKLQKEVDGLKAERSDLVRAKGNLDNQVNSLEVKKMDIVAVKSKLNDEAREQKNPVRQQVASHN